MLGSVEAKLPIAVEVTNDPLSTVDEEDNPMVNESNCKRVCSLLSNPSFVFIMITLAMFWFMVCGT